MCAVSMIHDFYREHREPTYWHTAHVGLVSLDWQTYQELLRKAAEYDRMTNQPDCEDPKKAAFHDQVEEILRKRGLIT